MSKKETPMILGKLKDKAIDLKVIQYFLDKRDINKGGVEGFSTPFSFKWKELAKLLKVDARRIRHIMERMDSEVVTLIYQHRNIIYPYQVDLMASWKCKKNSPIITVYQCSTEKLKAYRQMVEDDTFLSQKEYLNH